MENIHPFVKTPGTLRRYISDKLIRASVVEMTELVKEACAMQKTSPTSSVALARVLVGTSLLASQMKEKHELAVRFSCEGDLNSLFAHGSYQGMIRGTVGNKQAPLSLHSGQLSLAPLVKGGTMTYTTYIPKGKDPVKSQLSIVSGEVGEDFAYYLHQSRQIPCLISLGVKLGADGVEAAGGVLIELMPGHTEETLVEIEKNYNSAPSLSELLESKVAHSEILAHYIGSNMSPEEIQRTDIIYGCTCRREKALASVELLNHSEIKEIIADEKPLDIHCDMCGLTYKIEIPEIVFIERKKSGSAVH